MRRAILFCILLAGCVGSSDPVSLPRYYVNYKAYLIEQFDHSMAGGPNASVSGPIIFAFENCAADAAMAQYTPEQRATLDAYARREITMTGEQLRDINASSRFDNPSQDALYAEMEKVCPADVPVFRQAFRS